MTEVTPDNAARRHIMVRPAGFTGAHGSWFQPMDDDVTHYIGNDFYEVLELAPAATVTALEAEVRELGADRDSWRDQASERVKDWDKQRQRADAAERRVAELEANDRRYRYLRDHARPDSDTGEAVTRQELGDWGKWYTQHLSGGFLDAVIDHLTVARAK